jgi:prepilin-type N-terminal cleavage/methylation domain-containing protein/prepilin-type processing-associated H-X9-DG protein
MFVRISGKMPEARRKTGARGFTLLELLAVLAIIVVLASLLSAAFNQSKGKAQRIACLGNLRQLHWAWSLYYDDHEDVLPLNRSIASPNEKLIGRRNTTNSWVAGNPREDVSTRNIERGTLFPYIGGSAQIYRCPSDQSTVLGHNIPRTRGYSMSAYMSGDNEGVDPRVKTKYSQIISPSPSTVFVFIEEHESSSWMGSFAVMPLDRFSLLAGNWLSTPSDRHNQGCHLTFADGHVEYWKWYPARKSAFTQQVLGTTQDIRNLKRLQERVPSSH